MPHPYLHRASTERGRRNTGRHNHAAREAFNAVFQDKGASKPDHAPELAPDDPGSAPESGEKPEVLAPDRPTRR